MPYVCLCVCVLSVSARRRNKFCDWRDPRLGKYRRDSKIPHQSPAQRCLYCCCYWCGKHLLPCAMLTFFVVAVAAAESLSSNSSRWSRFSECNFLICHCSLRYFGLRFLVADFRSFFLLTFYCCEESRLSCEHPRHSFIMSLREEDDQIEFLVLPWCRRNCANTFDGKCK